MKRPAEIVVDLRRERIRETVRAIAAAGGRPTAGRIARDSGLAEVDVVALLPTFRPEELRELVDVGEQLAAAA